jgi:hypothetical protein
MQSGQVSNGTHQVLERSDGPRNKYLPVSNDGLSDQVLRDTVVACW